MRYNGVIFDLDDTLWDFQANAKEALEIVWKRISILCNLEPSLFAEFLQIYNMHNDRLWKEYREGQRGATTIKVERFIATANDMGGTINTTEGEEIAKLYLEKLYQGKILMSGALDILKWLQGKCKVGLITNGFAAGLKRLKDCEIEQYFNAIVNSELFGLHKPHPEIFIHTIKLLGGEQAEAKDYVYIGDNYEGDIIGAKNAGLSGIYFNVHQKDYSDYKVRPNAVIYSLSELPNIL